MGERTIRVPDGAFATLSDSQHRHAEMVAALLRALGPRPRARMLLVLRALGLSDSDAAAAIQHGLASRLFEADPADPEILRAVPPS